MKNVRLFAVAAAMGMFASTVSAAAPVVTKDGYVATWGEVDEIVKVDVGDKVVMPAATISVVKESRTTDTDYMGTSTTLGVSAFNDTCYVGFTNEIGEDTNHDGFVDTPILTMYPGAAADGWFYTDTKFFSSVETSLYYIGQAGTEIYGARFLAPGSEKNKGSYHATADHKDLANVDEVIAYMTEKGYISKIDVDGDGYNDYVLYNSKTFTSVVEGYEGKTLGTVWNQITIPATRNAEALLDEGLVNAFINSHAFGANFVDNDPAVVTGATEAVLYTRSTGDVSTYKAPYYADFGLLGDGVTPNPKNSDNLNGQILVVTENRYGELVPSTYVASIASGSDVAGLGISGEIDKVKVAIYNARTGKYSLHSTANVKAQKTWTIEKENNWSAVSGSFNATDRVYPSGTLAGTTFTADNGAAAMSYLNGLTPSVPGKKVDAHTYNPSMDANTEGLYQITAEANTSDKIVINTHGTNLTLDITGINTAKGIMTIDAPNGEEYTVSAVKLADGNWYPAVDNKEQLLEFVEIFAGLHTPKTGTAWTAGTSTSETWAWADYYKLLVGQAFTITPTTANGNLTYAAAAGAPTLSTIKYIDGTTEKTVIDNPLHHYSATQCTYKVAEGTTANAVVTSNADSIDTSVAGVKTLTLTAKVDGEEVATKEVKVVVAPKYERVYKNGKVVKLTAKWLNGNTYAVYNYDWAAKTYTATFYESDGVTVAANSNGSL